MKRMERIHEDSLTASLFSTPELKQRLEAAEPVVTY